VALLEIKNPVATADIRWSTASEGGRVSGPPTAPVYTATAVFCLGGEAETVPEWPASADQLSILVQSLDRHDDGADVSLIGFLFPDLARPYLHPGAELLILEGPKVVARATIRDLIAE
jgi:hypothetical protein